MNARMCSFNGLCRCRRCCCCNCCCSSPSSRRARPTTTTSTLFDLLRAAGGPRASWRRTLHEWIMGKYYYWKRARLQRLPLASCSVSASRLTTETNLEWFDEINSTTLAHSSITAATTTTTTCDRYHFQSFSWRLWRQIPPFFAHNERVSLEIKHQTRVKADQWFQYAN